MKKVLYITLAALAFAACAKTEANYTATQEISFAPVSQIDTKAAIEGSSYSENYPFYVYANAISEGQTTFNSKYFEKVEFVKDADLKYSGNQVYKGKPSQYWPNVNPLVFAGFTKAGNIEKISKENITASEVLDVITIPGYTQPRPTVNASNDLMYFFADNNGKGYDKNTTYVDPVMKHACSWITININADRDLVNYWNNLKVTNIHFVDLHETGTLTLRAVETEQEPAVEWTLTQDYDKVEVRNQELAIETSFKEFADIKNNTIVLPQVPTDLSVTYSYTTPAGVEGFTETKILSLDYDGAMTPWEPGKHYTYNLTLTAKEIKIAPSSTTWETTSSDKTI